jgi:hypothetical protein
MTKKIEETRSRGTIEPAWLKNYPINSTDLVLKGRISIHN